MKKTLYQRLKRAEREILLSNQHDYPRMYEEVMCLLQENTDWNDLRFEDVNTIVSMVTNRSLNLFVHELFRS